jgi:arylsulfatase A-like enzyme
MTGRYSNSSGVWHTIGGRSLLRRDEWSLADALSESGYATGIFGKWHLGDEYPYRPQDRGFQTSVCHGGGGISQQHDWWGNDYFDDTYLVNGEPTAFRGYCTDVFFDEALKFIDAHRTDPFFCFISTNAPHSPFNVEPRYRDMYTAHTDNENYARFLGMITNIDENLGRLRTHLQDRGLEENTILMFMSDNGQTGGGGDHMYNAGLRGMKGSEYEGGHRIPFFASWPQGGIAGGRAVGELASYVDFMPTVLDLCGVEVPTDRSFHGESLVPVMRGTAGAGDRDASEHWRERVVVTDTQRVPHPIKWRRSCVMKDRWRLVDRDELYDIEGDPGQNHDIAAEHPELVEELRNAYERWWELCSEQMDDEIPISIGSEAQEADGAVLRTHDMRNESGSVVWNQGDVRRGITSLGYWEVDVERPGSYEFELKRWPSEAGHAIRSGIEGDDVEWYREGVQPGSEGLYTGGEALPFTLACLRISGLKQESAEVAESENAARFRVNLSAGRRHLRAYFQDPHGLMSSAYYVYVRRV